MRTGYSRLSWLAQFSLSVALVAIAISGCCDKDLGVEIPKSVAVVEPVKNASFYDDDVTRNALPSEVLEQQSCMELDQLLVTGLVRLLRNSPSGEQCGGSSYRTYWESGTALPLDMPWKPNCASLDNNYACWRFERVMNIEGREIGTGEVRLYSPFRFPDDFPDAEDTNQPAPAMLNQGERGDQAPVIIVRSYALTDPNVDGFPEDIEADADGRYRCTDVYHGYFTDDEI